MTTPTREAIFAALWARVSAAQIGGQPAFKTSSRIVEHWDDVQAEEYNCLFMGKANEVIERSRGLDPKTWLYVSLYIYARTNARSDEGAQAPSTIMNNILDALDETLRPDEGSEKNVCTLGGLVSHAWITGEIVTAEGTLGDVEIAVVPVEILVPAVVNQ